MNVESLKNLGLKNPYRVRELIKKAIKKYNLDLNGLTVFTETASNYYVVTPIIAAMAGAKVYAITNDSKYGNKELIKWFTWNFAEFCGVRDKIEIVYEKSKSIVNRANIITNLGFVRPIDRGLIDMMNDKAVIPYMCESWEFREGDIDMDYCRVKNIPVMGTDEGDIFDFCGPLCAKMLFDNDIEIYDNKIAVLSNDRFGEVVVKYICRIGGHVYPIENLTDDNNKEILKDCDALVIADHDINKINDILSNSDLPNTVNCVLFVANHKMYKTFADLGPKPVIDLHCAGLKVGEMMARARLKGLTVEQVELNALRSSSAQILRGN